MCDISLGFGVRVTRTLYVQGAPPATPADFKQAHHCMIIAAGGKPCLVDTDPCQTDDRITGRLYVPARNAPASLSFKQFDKMYADAGRLVAMVSDGWDAAKIIECLNTPKE